jgi:hypothetical protein
MIEGYNITLNQQLQLVYAEGVTYWAVAGASAPFRGGECVT